MKLVFNFFLADHRHRLLQMNCVLVKFGRENHQNKYSTKFEDLIKIGMWSSKVAKFGLCRIPSSDNKHEAMFTLGVTWQQ